MAEPARKFDDNPVPGNADSAPPGRPELKALEGGGETSDPTGKLSSVGDPSEQSGENAAPGGAGTGPEPLDDHEKSFYTKGGKTKSHGLFRGSLGSRKKKITLAIAVLFATIGATIIMFLALLPLKIIHIMHNLEDHFFSSSNSVMQKEVDQLESNYIKRYVFPSLKLKSAFPGKVCGRSAISTIDSNCRTVVTSSGLVSNLYKAWAQAGLEHDLANKYGIEFSYQAGHYYMKAPGLGLEDTPYDITAFKDSSGESLDDFISKDPQITKQYSSTKDFKASVAAKLDQAMQGESKYKQVMYKYKVGKYLEQKYGIKRCIIACDTRRDLSDWVNKKHTANIIRAQRVLQPNNELVGFVLGCIGKGTTTGDCSVLKKEDPASQPTVTADGCQTNCIAAGEPASGASASIETAVDSLAADYAIDNPEDLAKAQKIFEQLSGPGGYKQYLVEQVVGNLLGGTGLSDKASTTASNFAGKAVTGDIPGVGVVLLASQVNNMAVTAAAILPAMGYLLQTQTMVHEYAIYRTFADEQQEPTAPKDAAIVGSFVNSLGPGNQNATTSNDPEIGGTASAEQTPLYSVLLGNGTAQGSPNYKCNDGNPVPAGQTVCPEEKADSKSKADVQAIVKNEPSIIAEATGVVGYISNWFSNLGSKILGAIGINSLLDKAVSAFESLPGVSNLLSTIGGYLRDTFLPASPVGSNTSGGRTFDMLAGGNDVSANDYTHNGLGGVALTSQQSAAILDQQQQQQQLQYKNQSFMAQMFDTSSNDSLVTKMAMAMPSNRSQAQTAIASFFSNPIGKLASAFASVFTISHVHAAAGAQPDPFDITQYGYPTDDPIFSQDPEQYWDQHCTTNAETAAWNQAAADQSQVSGNTNGLYLADNLQPSQSGKPSPTSDPTGTNPCLLIQAAVGSAGAIYNSSLLTPDDY